VLKLITALTHLNGFCTGSKSSKSLRLPVTRAYITNSFSRVLPELGTGVDDPSTQRSLPEPFLEHGLLAAVNLHRQPVHGRFEDGPQSCQDGGPPPLGRGFFIVNQAIRRGDGRGGGCGGAVGVTRVFRETRISRGDVHATGGGNGCHCDGVSRTQRRTYYDGGRVLHGNGARETSARDCEYVTSATYTRVRNTLQLRLDARPPVRTY